jgi:hypothetical protein
MERDEDGVVLGSTRLSSSQRLHRKGDATREAGSLVGPMTAADSPSAISVFRMKIATENQVQPPRSTLQALFRLIRTVEQSFQRQNPEFWTPKFSESAKSG